MSPLKEIFIGGWLILASIIFYLILPWPVMVLIIGLIVGLIILTHGVGRRLGQITDMYPSPKEKNHNNSN